MFMMHDIKELKELNKQLIKQTFVEHSKNCLLCILMLTLFLF